MAKARAAGSFLGGLANNPAVVIIAIVGIALFIFRDKISGAFASVGEGFGNINIELPALPTIEFPSFPEFPTFEFPTIALPDIFGGATGGPVEQVGGFFEGIQQQINDFFSGVTGGGTTPPQFEGAGTPEDPFIVPSGGGGTGVPIQDELEVVFTPFIPSPEPIEVLDPEAGGEFGGGGPSFEGGFIFENPIDTLSEVLAAFPQLTASQAADFLAEFSGILPSQLPFIDPDITNITAPTGEVAGNVGPEELAEQEQIAACTSCQLFGLNCPLCNGV